MAVVVVVLKLFVDRVIVIGTHLESSDEGTSQDNDAKWRGSDSW